MTLAKKHLLYTGKAKSLYMTEKDEYLITMYRDDTTAFDGAKHEQLSQKGIVNNHINAFIMLHLAEAGVPTHFVELLNDTETLVYKLDMIPLESVMRNITAGSICRRLGIESGKALAAPLYELFYKSDELHDPLVNDQHAVMFGWATPSQLKRMHELTLLINETLMSLFAGVGLMLVDAKYEFGVLNGEVVLGDEISPDSCRIWDSETKVSLDKDRFRQDLGEVVESYQVIAERLGVKLPA